MRWPRLALPPVDQSPSHDSPRFVILRERRLLPRPKDLVFDFGYPRPRRNVSAYTFPMFSVNASSETLRCA